MVAMDGRPGAGARVRVVPAGLEHAASIQAELDAVTAERRWFFNLQAPTLAEVTSYLAQHLSTESPYFVALDQERAVGHCEIQRSVRPGSLHVGALGMGMLEPYRGRGIGARLLSACLAEAWAVGLLRVELEVFSDNARARGLYNRAGFSEEGVRRSARVVDRMAQDVLLMAKLAPSVENLTAPGAWERFIELAATASRYRQQSWVSEAVRVAVSPIHGRGLFAARRIPAGAIVGVLGGRLLDSAEFAEYQRQHPRYAAAAIGEDRHLVLDEGPLRFGNHSCDPNLWMGDEVTIIARGDIDPGEELTIDYALHTVDPNWRLACQCQASQCRGVITGGDWQLPTIQATYAGHFAPFINQRIDADRDRSKVVSEPGRAEP
jgi:RimJ/RimL family protein N-acetyltransferase